MENYHTTKDQQFRQEERQMSNAMDQAAEKRQSNYDIMLKALKEISVDYPADINKEQEETLCLYLIATAKTALDNIKP